MVFLVIVLLIVTEKLNVLVPSSVLCIYPETEQVYRGVTKYCTGCSCCSGRRSSVQETAHSVRAVTRLLWMPFAWAVISGWTATVVCVCVCEQL